MHDLELDTLADRHSLMGHPPRLRRGTTWVIKGQPAPAAGAGLVLAVPNDWWYRVLAIGFTFTADATVQYRTVGITYADGDGTVMAQVPALPLVYANQALAVQASLWPARTEPAPQSANSQGTAPAPGAFGTVCSLLALPAGTWTMGWQVEVTGAVAAGTDNDNMQLAGGGRTFSRAAYPAVAGLYPQQPVTFVLPAPTTINLQSVGAATAGTTYGGSMIATPAAPYPAQPQLPDMVLKSGMQVALTAGNFHGGDQISNVVVTVERYPSNWADGSLGADEDRQYRQLAAAIAAQLHGPW